MFGAPAFFVVLSVGISLRHFLREATSRITNACGMSGGSPALPRITCVDQAHGRACTSTVIKCISLKLYLLHIDSYLSILRQPTNPSLKATTTRTSSIRPKSGHVSGPHQAIIFFRLRCVNLAHTRCEHGAKVGLCFYSASGCVFLSSWLSCFRTSKTPGMDLGLHMHISVPACWLSNRKVPICGGWLICC
jgi:hypothetical protein